MFIDHGKLRVKCSFPYISIIKLEFSVEPNCHSYASIRLLLDEEEEAKTDQMLSNQEMEAITVCSLKDDGTENYPPVYAGLIQEISIVHVGGNIEAEVRAVSGSYLLDIEKKCRSFQDVSISYQQLAHSLLKDTRNAAHLFFAEDRKTDKPFIQYEETDYEFLKRVASNQNTCIYADIAEPMPRLIYGLWDGIARGDLEVYHYKMGNNHYHLKNRRSGGSVLRSDEQYYEVVVGDDMRIGDLVHFQGGSYRICTKKCALKRGFLFFTYTLAREKWLWQETFHNSYLFGASIAGTVLETEQEYLKIHLDIDGKQEKEKAYSYLWQPETGNLMYLMPETGTKVYLYIGSQDEGEARAVSCIRRNGTTSPLLQNTDKRYLYNEHGKNMKLHEEKLEFEGSSKQEQSQFHLADKTGITLNTSQVLNLQAGGGIQIKGKTVTIKAANELTVYKQDFISPTMVNISDTVDVRGKKSLVTSAKGKEAKALISSSQEQMKPYVIDDIRDEILSTVPQDVEEDELTAVVSGSMVNNIYAEK